MPELIGLSLGPYRIVERIGRGGVATVYKAYHAVTDRYVAIKVFPAHLADEPHFLARFEREARAVADLQHTHILPVFDYGAERGLTYLVMPYIRTGTLKDFLMTGQPALAETIRLFCQIAEAVDYAHRSGMIHQDLKPGNVLLDDHHNALLSDFVLTRLAGSGVIGTPAYMSPEQGQGQEIDERSDIYSLGVILYEMVVGRVPFSADTPTAVIFKHINEPLPLPRQQSPAVPAAVQNVILKALAKNPDDRFQTVAEMVEVLRSAVTDIDVAEAIPAETQQARTKPARTKPTRATPAAASIPRADRLWHVLLAVLLLVIVLAAVAVAVMTLIALGILSTPTQSSATTTPATPPDAPTPQADGQAPEASAASDRPGNAALDTTGLIFRQIARTVP